MTCETSQRPEFLADKLRLQMGLVSAVDSDVAEEAERDGADATVSPFAWNAAAADDECNNN